MFIATLRVLVARGQTVAAHAALLAAAEREHETEANFREGSALKADVQKASSQRAQAEAATVAATTQERGTYSAQHLALTSGEHSA